MSIRSVLVSVVLFLFTSSLAHANLVASTPGEFSVSSTGAATYSVPIVVPPGTAGVEPKLSLNYSSQGRNGLLGVGWMIGGLSVIHRCPANLVKDGFIDGIDFDDNDRFCLDGQPLIAINGTYGANNTEYRTEINNFSKIISYGSTGNGPEMFKVWTKSGEIMEYGYTNDSRINPPLSDGTAQSDALCWLLNKVTDTVGNFMTVTYFEDTSTGENYPLQIDYTGNADLTPYNLVEFIYEARSDVSTRYLSGFKMESTKRLKTISSKANLNEARIYQLGYVNSEENGRSTLSDITECDGNNICMPSTEFTWKPSSLPNWQWEDTTNLSPQAVIALEIAESGIDIPGLNDHGVRFVDLNGDGLQDMVHSVRWDDNNETREAWLNTGAAWTPAPNYAPPVHIAIALDEVLYNHGVRFVDLNGDGLQDIIHGVRWDANNETRNAWINNGTTWVEASNLAPQAHIVVALDEQLYDHGVRFADLNGDGLQDMVHSVYWSATNNTREAWLNTGASWTIEPDLKPETYFAVALDGKLYDHGARLVDLNGDGLQDMVLGVYWSAANNTREAWLNTGSDWISAPNLKPQAHFAINLSGKLYDHGARFVDLNSDGLQDMVHGVRWSASNETRNAWLNTGTGWHSAPNLKPQTHIAINLDGKLYDHGVRYVDLNGDGFQDMVHGVRWSASNETRNAWLNSGIGWNSSTEFSPAAHFAVYINGNSYVDGALHDHGVRFVDLNGDGLQDIVHGVRWDANNVTRKTWLNKDGLPDMLVKISNGLGIDIEIDYEPITNNTIYTKGSGANFPEIDLQAPMYVVSESRTDNGVGGQNTLTYEYEGAIIHVQGRGLLGFAKRTVTDVDTNIVIETNYKQEFPYIGQVASTKTTVDGTLVSEEINTFAALGNTATGPAFPYASPAVSKAYDLTSGALLTTVTTDSTYDSYGNPTNITVTTNDVGIDTYTTTTVNTYTNDVNNWFLGRLTQAVVSKTGGAQASPSRTSTFEYNSVNGLLTKETIEPGSAYELVKTYQHDNFGNRISVTESGAGITARTTTSSYDSKGQFPTTVTNALGHVETREYNDPYGNVTKLTGPNNLNTFWEYDSLGRKKRELRADGTETNMAYAFCTGGTSCPSQVNGLASYKITTTTTGAATSIAYYDAVNRVILAETQSFDGTSVFVETKYDAQGRVAERTNPYFGTSTTYKTEYTYDDLGRVTQEISPTTGTTLITYNGFVTTSVNDLNQTSKEKTNSIGQTIWTEDDNGNKLNFAYDAQGNLISVADSESNVTSNSYNIRGFKTQMIDPDMGTWNYTYNVLGELTSQTDAKNQTVSMVYDKLGRLFSRTEPEGSTTWTYDTATKGKGKLASVSHYGGFSRSHAYDSLGRPSSTTTVIGGTSYTTSTTYDAFGRVDDITYPSTNFKVDHVYNAHGYLEQVRNANNASEVFYKALAADHFGNITSEQAGNGIVTFRSYQQNSGRIHHIDSVIQDLEYIFNDIGNLTQRKDVTQNLTENFTYDNLNRLKTANVVGVGTSSFSFDNLGNITYKSDVGNYTYGAGNAGPHAVTNAGGNTYTYDANGNQITGDGKNITWSSFNKPTQITKGSNQSNFTYGPDRARYLQVTTEGSNTTTTTYIGGLYEKVEKGSTTEEKHFIRAGSQTIAIFTDRSNGADTTEYLHRDHLGSIDTITDANGNVVEKLSYDAFGKRRLSNWNNGIPSIVSNNNRGFTGHEMLDAVGLIHMNGRVYDPLLARFMSADPTLQFPKNMQNYNRYSYVLNNPLSFTDPSGFFIDDIIDAVTDFVDDVVDAVSSVLDNPYVRAVVAIAAAAFTYGAVLGSLTSGIAGPVALSSISFTTAQVIASAAGGFVGGLIGSGGDLSAAVVGGVTGGAAGFIGSSASFGGLGSITPQRVIAHGVVGGAAAEAQGGKFGQGFVSSAFTKSVSGKIQDITRSDPVAGGVAAAVVGGTASELSGGKFKNGALTNAFQYLFNQVSQELGRAIIRTRYHAEKLRTLFRTQVLNDCKNNATNCTITSEISREIVELTVDSASVHNSSKNAAVFLTTLPIRGLAKIGGGFGHSTFTKIIDHLDREFLPSDFVINVTAQGTDFLPSGTVTKTFSRRTIFKSEEYIPYEY